MTILNKDFKKDYKKFVAKYNMVGSNVIVADSMDEYISCSTGFASLETQEKSRPNNIYRIASISKVVVAMGLLKLYDKGLVDIDDDISKYLGYIVRNPYFPTSKITLRMIMSQSSSISDNVYDKANATDDYISLQSILEDKDTYLDAEPGKNFKYSNLGCGILACVIEKITNTYFPTYIKEEVLEPLGIKSGFRLEDLKYQDRLVSHYLYNPNTTGFTLYRDYDLFKEVQCLVYPLGDNYRGVAGGLYISSLDLYKIMQVLMHKGIYKDVRILKEETVEEMEKVQWEGESGDPTYKKKGLQLIIMDEFTISPLYGHFGNAYGLRSFMLYNENGGMIFLCNGANFLNDVEHMTVLQKDIIEFIVNEVKL